MDISIVVISFNSANFLKDNIASLLGQTVPFKEIIVVDNNSRDNSLEILRQYKDIQLIAQDTNTGYAAGANTGIRAATADLVMVANADIILKKNFNHLVIDRFTSNREIALLSPLLLRFDKTTVDSAGQRLSSSLYPQEIGYGQPLQSLDLNEGPVFSVCGAATVFPAGHWNNWKWRDTIMTRISSFSGKIWISAGEPTISGSSIISTPKPLSTISEAPH